MTFSELTVIRKADNKVMLSIKPGGYAYMYEGIENDPTELNKIVDKEEKEDNTEKLIIKRAKKPQEDEEEKLGPVKLSSSGNLQTIIIPYMNQFQIMYTQSLLIMSLLRLRVILMMKKMMTLVMKTSFKA